MSYPAAWHPDPVGRYEYRYWDGQRWTEHVANQGVAGVDPVGVAAPQAGGWGQQQGGQQWGQQQAGQQWGQQHGGQQAQAPQPQAAQAPQPQTPQPQAWAAQQPYPQQTAAAAAEWQQPWTEEPAADHSPQPSTQEPATAAHWQQPWTEEPAAEHSPQPSTQEPAAAADHWQQPWTEETPPADTAAQAASSDMTAEGAPVAAEDVPATGAVDGTAADEVPHWQQPWTDEDR